MYIDDKDIHGYKYNGKIYCKRCAQYYEIIPKVPFKDVLTEAILDKDPGEYFCDICKIAIHEPTKPN